MTSQQETAFDIGRLLQWGLRSRTRPATEPDYAQLVERFLDDPSFRSLLRATADGLGLQVLDVSGHGIVLAPTGDSIFALPPSAYRPGTTSADERLLDGLVQVAIAATVFPRARDLEEDPDVARPPVTVDEVEEVLRQVSERLELASRDRPDPTADDVSRGLYEAWRVYRRYASTVETKDARKSRRATRRVIEYGLERLRDYGCFTQLRSRATGEAWQPTRRYQVLVRELAATELYQHVRALVEATPPPRDPVAPPAAAGDPMAPPDGGDAPTDAVRPDAAPEADVAEDEGAATPAAPASDPEENA